MTQRTLIRSSAALLVLLLADTSIASVDSIGPKGINSINLPLTGNGIGIGQVEPSRPGDPNFDTNAALFHTDVDATQVFYRNQANFNASADMGSEVSPHAVEIAGLIISDHAVARGVATDANLYSIGINPVGPMLTDTYAQAAHAAQHVAALPAQDIWAINMSINASTGGADANGNSLFTSFIDWSARAHDVLYVIAGFEMGGTGPIPSDNFNGITAGASTKLFGGDTYVKVDSSNDFTGDDFTDRTFVDLLAPGRDVQMATTGNMITTVPDFTRVGTSIAAPHVTGTVALLQEHADKQIAAGAPRWDATRARRHEVMKAVLMNSADKLIDDGTVMVGGNAVPQGSLLGMERTVIDQNGNNWLQSEAFDDSVLGGGFVPLDDQMGTGHLNANRAFRQFRTGEFDAEGNDVPIIGWDYGHTTGEDDTQSYVFAQKLIADSFISITLAWDRLVLFDNDADMDGEFDIGDTFLESHPTFPDPPSDDQINDLDLYLLPKGSFNLGDAIASANAIEGTVEHIFFQIPTTGEYEF